MSKIEQMHDGRRILSRFYRLRWRENGNSEGEYLRKREAVESRNMIVEYTSHKPDDLMLRRVTLYTKDNIDSRLSWKVDGILQEFRQQFGEPSSKSKKNVVFTQCGNRADLQFGKRESIFTVIKVRVHESGPTKSRVMFFENCKSICSRFKIPIAIVL